MVIDDLNSIAGVKSVHYIYYVTTQQFNDGIQNIVYDFAFKYDFIPTLYKLTGDHFNPVNSTVNVNFINHTINMATPDSYAGLQHLGYLDNLWPPTVDNGLMYVCDTFDTLLSLTDVKQGSFAIVGDNTYILNMYPSNRAGSWLKLKSSVVAVYTVPIPTTSEIFVDFKRTDTYTANGSREYPFKTLTDAYTAAVSFVTASSPITIVLISGNTVAENVTIAKGHIFITGDTNSWTHSPIIFTGSLTFSGQNNSINENHFAVSGIGINGVNGTNVITVSGNHPQRLYLKDVWVTVNGSSHGINITNADSITYAIDSKIMHNGTGDYHCINMTAGVCNLDNIETTGNTLGVAAVSNGAHLNLTNSTIETSGSYAIEVYGTSSQITLNDCTVITTAANSHGIELETAGATAYITDVSFSVPVSATGKVIQGVAGTYLYYGKIYYLPDSNGVTTNTQINPLITKAPIASLG